jgi:hypothetical protein
MKILNSLALVMCLAAPAAASTSPASAGQAGAGPAAQTPTAAAAATADVLGTWDMTVTTRQAAIPSQLKLKKDSEKIVGTISSQVGETPVQAEVKGKDLSVWFNYQGQSGPMAVELNGTVDGDSAKGSMVIGGQVGGEWVATRAKGSNPAPAKDAKEPAAAAKIDLTGTYNVTVELPSMTANPTVVLKQDGDKLTGEYLSAQYGKFPITGTIKGAEVSFWFAMNIEGTGLDVTYTGTVDKDGALRGTVNYGDMMSGTFSASRKK